MPDPHIYPRTKTSPQTKTVTLSVSEKPTKKIQELASSILRHFIQTLHRESTLAFLTHLDLIFYRTIEANVKCFAILDCLQFYLIDLPLMLGETGWLVHNGNPFCAP